MNDLLNNIQLVIETPELYLANYFFNLKSQVDLIYANKCASQDDVNSKNIWLKLINKIDLFETLDLTDLTYDELKHNEFVLKKELFTNKTIFFLDAATCKDTSLFKEKQYSSQLVHVMDGYISDEAIDLLKNSEYIEPINNTLTQEYLNLKILKEKIKQSTNELNEIYLNLQILKVVHLQKDIFEMHQICINSLDSKTFTNLTTLTEINLTSNSIVRLDSDTFNGLINLQELKLGYNKIDYLDPNIFNDLFNLKHLYLNNNRIKSLNRDQFKGLTSLKELYLHSNQINLIDYSILKHLNKLEILDMASNRLTQIDVATFTGVISLKVLDLRYNSLSPSDLKSLYCLNNLRELHLPVYLTKIYSIKLNSIRNG